MSSVAGPETPPPLNGTRYVTDCTVIPWARRARSPSRVTRNVSPRTPYRRSSWYGGWLPSWKPTSEEHLEKAEKCILDCKSEQFFLFPSLFLPPSHFSLLPPPPALSSEYKDLYVTVGPGAVIRSILLEPDQPQEEEKPPLVLLHGFGCGIPQFYKNLDHLHSDRRLYALDLPGFARSTRVPFPVDAEGAECEFVETLERWREGVGLEQMVLLGHSLGGFLSLSYAMRYPSRVRHLILDDPWGMVSMPPEEEMREKFSVLVRSIIIPIATRFKPFDWIRAFGPLGRCYTNKAYIITTATRRLR